MNDLWRPTIQTGTGRTIDAGVPALTSDLRCLFRAIDLLQGIEDDADADAMVPTVLDIVVHYAAFHFDRQERVMAAMGFEGVREHRTEHDMFLHWVKRCREDLADGAGAMAACTLWEDLSAWLRHHALLQDTALRSELDDVDAAERVARAGAEGCLLRPAPVPTPVPAPARPPVRRQQSRKVACPPAAAALLSA